MTLPLALLLQWVFCHKDGKAPELSFWLGHLNMLEVTRIYELGHDDWIISAVGPTGVHAGLSLFHVSLEKAQFEATRLVQDMWG